MFEIEIAPKAREDLKEFRKFEQVRILEVIDEQLIHQPNAATRNRKHLRPGHITEWELRIDEIRVFYDVDPQLSVVRIAAIGYKEGNKLFFRGKEYPS